MQICPNCGEENPDRFRLCGICGTKLVPDTIDREVRKTVTIVFCDLKGSTSLGERLDTESLREVLSVYFNEMRSILERHGGTVEKYIGDAIMAVFGLPKLHEDDALRAVRAAAEMQRALQRVNDRLEAGWGVRLENRTGVNTGEVVAGDVSTGQRLVTGDTVNTAARLEQAAPAVEVLIGEPTYRLVRDAVEVEPVEPLELKGKADRVAAYRLISVAEREDGISRRLDAPLVGRVRELAELQAALHRAERERRAQLVTVFGPAGVGKSRLLREFVNRSSGAAYLSGRCLSYGDGITFWPLAEVVRGAAGIVPEDSSEDALAKLHVLAGLGAADAAERVAAAIGLSERTFPVQETFWGARRMIETLAASRTTIVLIDDIHWAEPTFLDLLRYLVDTVEAPLVLVCSSRPELLEEHSEWIQQTDRTRSLLLEPLTSDESEQVVENLLGASLDLRVRERVVRAAEGNPLFVEQMLSMLIDDGIVARDPDGGWRLIGDVRSITVPVSISSLLSARLDRLSSTDRAVVERGAVVGQIFFRSAVETLVDDALRPHVGESLLALARKELIRPDPTAFVGLDGYRFLHILIRDAAYHGLLKRTRAELHERFVDWLEASVSDRVTEYEEIRGYHLEQAFVIRTQLGPVDDATRAVGARGAAYLASAGRRALARGDMPAAESLLRRAAALLPTEDAGRSELLMLAGEALTELGEFKMADDVLAASIDAAEGRGDERAAETPRLVRLELHYATEGRPEDAVLKEIERAIDALERWQDHAGLARAYRLLTIVHWTACRYAAAEDATVRMIEQAELAGDEVMVRRYLGSIAMSEVFGPSPVAPAIARCEELLAQTEGDRKAEALIQCLLGHLRTMQGDADAGRELFARSRSSLEELGWKLEAALTSLDSGPAELLLGEPARAEAELRADFDQLQAMGERNYISTIAGHLAEAVYRQGRLDEAERLAAFCAEVAAADDVTSQVVWRCVSAKILADRGEIGEAERLARDAVDLLAATDSLDLHATALLELGTVLATAERTGEAAVAAEDALELFERKGNVVGATTARAAIDALRGAGDRRTADPS